MDKSHSGCKECIANHYWHHMHDGKRFFKILIDGFRNKMIIPRKFADNMRAHISEEVKLEVPEGKTYAVQVAKEKDNLVLRSGWADFASAYELDHGDLLVFRSSGSSHFRVRIYDRSGCEKELSCVQLGGIPCLQGRKDPKNGSHMQSPTGKRMAIGSSSGVKKASKTTPTDSPSQKTAEHVPASEGIQEPMNSGGVQKTIKPCIVLPTGWNMTSEQEAKVIALERKIQPKIPLYITAMDKKSVAGGILAISRNYAMKHLAKKEGVLQLSLLDGSKRWPIDLYTNTDGHYALSTGWLKFIRENRLQEGDICIFEPTRSKKRVALIFHPLDESRRLQPTGYAPAAKTRSPRHRLPEPPYMFPRFTALNDQQKSQIDKKVEAIQSDIPIYGAIMNSCNITKHCLLQIGVDYGTKYLPRESQTIMLQCPEQDRSWKADLHVRDRRYTLEVGWKEFVDGNRLKLGDICLFELMKNSKPLTMMVHIIRLG